MYYFRVDGLRSRHFTRPTCTVRTQMHGLGSEAALIKLSQPLLSISQPLISPQSMPLTTSLPRLHLASYTKMPLKTLSEAFNQTFDSLYAQGRTNSTTSSNNLPDLANSSRPPPKLTGSLRPTKRQAPESPETDVQHKRARTDDPDGGHRDGPNQMTSYLSLYADGTRAEFHQGLIQSSRKLHSDHKKYLDLQQRNPNRGLKDDASDPEASAFGWITPVMPFMNDGPNIKEGDGRLYTRGHGTRAEYGLRQRRTRTTRDRRQNYRQATLSGRVTRQTQGNKTFFELDPQGNKREIK